MLTHKMYEPSNCNNRENLLWLVMKYIPHAIPHKHVKLYKIKTKRKSNYILG